MDAKTFIDNAVNGTSTDPYLAEQLEELNNNPPANSTEYDNMQVEIVTAWFTQTFFE